MGLQGAGGREAARDRTKDPGARRPGKARLAFLIRKRDATRGILNPYQDCTSNAILSSEPVIVPAGIALPSTKPVQVLRACRKTSFLDQRIPCLCLTGGRDEVLPQKGVCSAFPVHPLISSLRDGQNRSPASQSHEISRQLFNFMLVLDQRHSGRLFPLACITVINGAGVPQGR